MKKYWDRLENRSDRPETERDRLKNVPDRLEKKVWPEKRRDRLENPSDRPKSDRDRLDKKLNPPENGPDPLEKCTAEQKVKFIPN
ncbi:hypothetical protein [Metabacillus sp. FJAT-52054]|uniref:Uncharacterized protein n=1 Tax=Metabacillus sediminis TaxID=3117746 RepID=A0ABZ2NFR4_9BACI